MSRELTLSSIFSVAALSLLCIAATGFVPANDKAGSSVSSGAISAQTAIVSGLRD